MKKLLSISLLALTLTGCERTRSMLQMDSNSGSPFLGLQLSVDAQETHDRNVAEIDVSNEATQTPPIQTARSKRSADFVLTSQSRINNSKLKYSLPKADLSRNVEAAAEIEDIRRRL